MDKLAKIRAEIERRIEEIKAGDFYDQLDSHRKEIVDILNDNLSFIDSMQEELVCEDLEKEMQHYFCKEWAGDPVAAARHFADWQKEQMMKDAIDTVMIYDDLNDLVPGIEDLSINGYTVGDKVKVIIIKDE